MDPLVSIIIPCFNAEKWIGEAIESALKQTYANKEVIVIDDGSTDRSVEVIRGFGDAVRWETRPNRGGCAARNRGIDLANGEFIQFLDADDMLYPEKLSQQASILSRSSAGLVFCDGELCELETRNRIGRFIRAFDHGDPVRFVLDGVFPIEAPLHRRAFLASVGKFCEGLPAAQEFDLHLRLACSGMKFERFSKVLYSVRRRHDSVSSGYVRAVSYQLELARRAYDTLQDRGELDDLRAHSFAALMARLGRGCMQRAEQNIARLFLAEGRRMHRSGGIDAAYAPSARILYRLIGARWTERLVGLKRSVFNRAQTQTL